MKQSQEKTMTLDKACWKGRGLEIVRKIYCLVHDGHPAGHLARNWKRCGRGIRPVPFKETLDRFMSCVLPYPEYEFMLENGIRLEHQAALRPSARRHPISEPHTDGLPDNQQVVQRVQGPRHFVGLQKRGAIILSVGKKHNSSASQATCSKTPRTSSASATRRNTN